MIPQEIKQFMMEVLFSSKKKEYMNNDEIILQEFEILSRENKFYKDLLQVLKIHYFAKEENLVEKEEIPIQMDSKVVDLLQKWELLRQQWLNEDIKSGEGNQLYQLYRKRFQNHESLEADIIVGFRNCSKDQNLFLDIGYRKLSIKPLEMIPALSHFPLLLSKLPNKCLVCKNYSHTNFEIIYAFFPMDHNLDMWFHSGGYYYTYSENGLEKSREKMDTKSSLELPFHLERKSTFHLEN